MNRTVEFGSRTGYVRIPSSKSVVHRLLICAALGKDPVSLQLNGISRDIQATADCLRAMGAEIAIGDTEIQIDPAGIFSDSIGESMLPCAESGSTLRFLLPLAGALGKSVCFQMEGRLPDRPISPFDSVLCNQGMHIEREKNLLHCRGHLNPGEYVLPGNVSSQFFSGLLMALPVMREGSILRADGSLESEGYISLTEDALQRSRISFSKDDTGEWTIPGNQQYRLSGTVSAEGDWSNAAFFLCMGAFSDRGIEVQGLNLKSRQGDRAILQLLRDFGAEVQERDDSILVCKADQKAFTVDAGAIPDLIPVLAVLACAAEGNSVIENAGRLRMKESDRLYSTVKLINDLGGRATEGPNSLVIHGSGCLRGGTADSCNDHRIAMSAAVAASICRDQVIVTGAECVNKSYPAFWKDLEEL